MLDRADGEEGVATAGAECRRDSRMQWIRHERRAGRRDARLSADRFLDAERAVAGFLRERAAAA